MGVSSTRVGDQRGSARTVQFLSLMIIFQIFSHIDSVNPEVRTSALWDLVPRPTLSPPPTSILSTLVLSETHS